ncbi:MAG: protein kinase [Myxococcales bacterium]|nr:protein kinase [Myxococcales bacterium]
MSSVEGNDLTGLTLDDRYRLERHLGQGAMGQVYIAHDAVLDLRVAVKVLHPWLASEDKHRKRFLREARAATRIRHPNVVEMRDFGTTPTDSVYLVMELLHGRDLQTVLQTEGPLPWPRVRHFLLQAVAALREAHRQEVIHRDIKPANCFVCDPPVAGQPERIKLLDFGIAKVEGDPGASATGSGGKPLTQTGELVGTLAYMAPEFADGRPASVHTDMYALGIMAYQLITGDVPFRGRNEFQVLARHLNEPPVRPRVLVPELPEAAEAVVLTMLAKKPALRFENMADLEQALLAIPGDGSGPLVLPHREGSPEAPQIRRRQGTPRPLAPPFGRVQRLTPSMALDDRPGPLPPRARGTSVTPGGEPTLPGPPLDELPSDDAPPDSDVWSLGEPIELPPEAHLAPVDDDDDELVRLPRREWGTTATVILLVLLSIAAVASVVIRQQGIELRWPWSPEASPPTQDQADPPGEAPTTAPEVAPPAAPEAS